MAQKRTGKQPLFGGTEQGVLMGWLPGILIGGAVIYIVTRPKKKKGRSSAGGGTLPPPMTP